MSRAHAIETRLEKQFPVLDEFYTSGFLTREEVQEVSRQRTHWEYKLVAKPLALLDVQDAVRYELELEERLRTFCVTTRLTLKYRWSILERIERIYGIGLKNLKKGTELEELRTAYVCFLQRYERGQSLSRLYAEWMMKFPTRADIWIEAATWEGIHLHHMDNARTIVQQALLTMSSQPVVWCGALKLELHFVSHLLQGLVADVHTEKEENGVGSTTPVDGTTHTAASSSSLSSSAASASLAATSRNEANRRTQQNKTQEDAHVNNGGDENETTHSVSALLQRRLRDENAALAAVLFDLALAKAVVTEALQSPAGDDPGLVEALLKVTAEYPFAAAVQQTVLDGAMDRLMPTLVAASAQTAAHAARRTRPVGRDGVEKERVDEAQWGGTGPERKVSAVTATMPHTLQQSQVRWRAYAAHFICHYYLVHSASSFASASESTAAQTKGAAIPVINSVAAYVDHMYRELVTPGEAAAAAQLALTKDEADSHKHNTHANTPTAAAAHDELCALLTLLLFALAPTAAALRAAIPRLHETLITRVSERLACVARSSPGPCGVSAESVSRLVLLLLRSSPPPTMTCASHARSNAPAHRNVSAPAVTVAQVMQSLFGAKAARSTALRRTVLYPAESRIRQLCARFTPHVLGTETTQTTRPESSLRAEKAVHALSACSVVSWDVPAMRRLIVPPHRRREGRGAAALSTLLLWCDEEAAQEEEVIPAITSTAGATLRQSDERALRVAGKSCASASSSSSSSSSPALRHRCRVRLLRQAQQYGLLRLESANNNTCAEAKWLKGGVCAVSGLSVAAFVSEAHTPLTLWRVFAALERLHRCDADATSTNAAAAAAAEENNHECDDNSSSEEEEDEMGKGHTGGEGVSRRVLLSSHKRRVSEPPAAGRGKCARRDVSPSDSSSSASSSSSGGNASSSDSDAEEEKEKAEQTRTHMTSVRAGGQMWTAVTSFAEAGLHFLSGVTPDVSCATAQTEWERVRGVCALVRARLLSLLCVMCSSSSSSSGAEPWGESRISSHLFSVSGRGWTRVGVRYILSHAWSSSSPIDGKSCAAATRATKYAQEDMHAVASLLQRLRRCLPIPRDAYARLCIPFLEGWASVDGGMPATQRAALLSLVRQLHEEVIRLYGTSTHGELFVPLLYDMSEKAETVPGSSSSASTTAVVSGAAARAERSSRRALVHERNTEDWLAYVAFERVVAQDLSRARAVAARATHAALAPQQLLGQLNRASMCN